jgi:hypothetical protein
VSIRQVLPGEHLSPQCGHHCGVRSAAEEGSRLTFIGHCVCAECRCPMSMEGTISIPAIDASQRGVPMCDSWAHGLDMDPVILAIRADTARRLADDGV